MGGWVVYLAYGNLKGAALEDFVVAVGKLHIVENDPFCSSSSSSSSSNGGRWG